MVPLADFASYAAERGWQVIEEPDFLPRWERARIGKPYEPQILVVQEWWIDGHRCGAEVSLSALPPPEKWEWVIGEAEKVKAQQQEESRRWPLYHAASLIAEGAAHAHSMEIAGTIKEWGLDAVIAEVDIRIDRARNSHEARERRARATIEELKTLCG